MRISDWSSDVCSSDLVERFDRGLGLLFPVAFQPLPLLRRAHVQKAGGLPQRRRDQEAPGAVIDMDRRVQLLGRSEEHTSELQSLMRISYAVFCLKKKKPKRRNGSANRDKNKTSAANTTEH